MAGSGLSWRRWLVLAFLVCAAPVGFAAAWLTPPMQIPDEATHTARAAGLLHGAVLASRRFAPDPYLGGVQWEAGVMAPVPILNVALTGGSHGPLSAGMPRGRLNLRRRFFYYLPNTAMYFPAAYAPAALGMALVAAVHGTPAAGFFAGRLGGLAAYLALGAAALMIIEGGTAVLLAVLLLPMPLLLAGSLNQDGVLIALTCFAVAAISRVPAGGEGWRLAGLAGLALLAAAKPPYAPLMALAALPAGPWRWRAGPMAAAFGLVALWVGLNAKYVIVPFDYFPPGRFVVTFYHPGPLYPGTAFAWFYQMIPAMQMSCLRAHPLAAVTVVARAVAAWRPVIFFELVGPFGRLPLPVGVWLGWLWSAAWLAALVPLLRGPWCRTVPVGLLMLASFWAVMLSLYLNSTAIGTLAAAGFNARYLLPFLPCLALVLPRRPGLAGSLCVLAVGGLDLVYLPVLLWRSYGG